MHVDWKIIFTSRKNLMSEAGSLCWEMAKVLVCNIEVCEFELQS